MAGPLRAWQQLSRCIRQGKFVPDNSRSGRWADEVLEQTQSPQTPEPFNLAAAQPEKADSPAKILKAAVELLGEPIPEGAGDAPRWHQSPRSGSGAD